VDHHPEDGAGLLGTDRLDRTHRDRTPADGHAPPELLDHARRWEAVDEHLVLLLELVARVGDAVDQVSVVAEQEEAGAVAIEPASRDDSLRYLDQVEHRPPASLVASGRDVADRFVEDEVAPPLRSQRPAVDPDVLSLRIDAHAHLADHCPVHRDPARSNQLFRFAARCHAVLGEDALQPALHRVRSYHQDLQPLRYRREPIGRVQG